MGKMLNKLGRTPKSLQGAVDAERQKLAQEPTKKPKAEETDTVKPKGKRGGARPNSGGKRPGSGQPKKVLDQEAFEGLCEIQCTVAEISHVLKTPFDTIDGWCKRTYGEGFGEVRERLRSGGKASLRRIQFRLAENNASMAIFLGKNILDQTDQVVQKVETKQEIIQKRILELPDNGRREVGNGDIGDD